MLAGTSRNSLELPLCYVRSVSVVEVSVGGQDLLGNRDTVFYK